MKQADLGLSLTTKRTRKREFLDEMERVVPWLALIDLITPYAPEGKRGRSPFPVETMLRINLMQQWFTLSDPSMEEALYDAVEANALLHGEETEAWGDASYQGAAKQPDAEAGARWNIAMRPGKRRQLDKTKRVEQLIDQLERIKASIRAKVGHPFRVIKRQLGHIKVRYRGLKKNTAQLHTLFALFNLWMARRSLMGAQA